MKQWNIFWLVASFFLLTLGGCQLLDSAEDTEGKEIVARVNDAYLYKKDLKNIVDKSVSQRDSAEFIHRYIDAWVKKQVWVQKAEAEAQADLEDIEQRVQEYRYQLLIYSYQRQYIDTHLDTLVSPQQIEAYYKENLKNFELKQNILKGVMLKVPQTAPNLSQLRSLMRSSSAEAITDIKSYAYSFAELWITSDTTWIDFDDMVANTPFVSKSTPLQLLSQNKSLEAQDENYFYFIKILDYKIADQVSPLDYVSAKIKDIILNKRKIELQQKHEEEIWQEAERKKAIEIKKTP